ncbi:hypothetical protein [Sorangium sp. So ce131]|uniref:hypothetical protein n=1 Tax=Sorangium sp. So ce131 TaxID=3133282 RepID=UPI003F62C887
MDIDLPPLIYPDRVADAPIRGFLAQAYHTALRWIALGEREYLLCEGDEDIDRYFFELDGSLREIRQEQIKDLSGRISARSSAVHESIFNFLYSYTEHRKAGRRCRFLFTTNATMAAQRIQPDAAGASRSETVHLSVDVLRLWSQLASSVERTRDVGDLAANIRSLAEGYGPQEPAKGSLSPARLRAAIQYLDEEPSGWEDFLGAVEWRLDQLPYDALENALRERLAADQRAGRVPVLLSYRVLVAVLQASAHPDPMNRVLSAESLTALLTETEAELGRWAQRLHAERLSRWFTAIEARIDDHDRLLTEQGARLQRLDQGPLCALRRHSERTWRGLARFSGLKLGDTAVTLERPVVDAMLDMPGSYVLVGDPGCGKSGALYQLVARLRAERDVVLISADEIPEVGRPLLDVLEDWSEARNPVLVVDALDAARGEALATRVWKLIEGVLRSGSPFRVIASIRTFDLLARRSSATRLFAGRPHHSMSDPRFPQVAHVRVGPLDDSEIAQLASAFPELDALFRRASKALQELLRVPFNLSLVVRLLERGIAPAEIERVRTHLELLDMYWIHRVEEQEPVEDKLPRHELLRAACERIVSSRAFWVQVAGLPQQQALHGLLSGQVLVHPELSASQQDDHRVGFSHHILFDYACARLWLPDEPDRLAAELRERPDLVLVARPSLEMHLRRLWQRDLSRTDFWRTVLGVLAEPRVQEVAALIGPKIAAEEAVHAPELEPLVRSLGAQDPAERASAERALGHLVGALVRTASAPRPLTGEQAGPWCALVEATVQRGQPQAKLAAIRLLEELCASAALPVAERGTAGRAARAFFSWVDVARGDNAGLLSRAARLVIKTFDSDPAASATLLRRLLDAERTASVGFETMFALSDGVPTLLPQDPALIEDLYVGAFSYTDTSNDWLDLGGTVFGMRHRRSDMYGTALHRLAKHYPLFLARDPRRAVRALVQVLEAFRRREHGDVAREAEPFTFGAARARVKPDMSSLWDALRSRSGEEIVMLDALEARLVDVCRAPGRDGEIEALVDALVQENPLAAIWRRVLRAGARNPATVGPRFTALLASVPILTCIDTSTNAGDYLRSQFASLPEDARICIERAILSIADADDPEGLAHTTRARLLGCLPRHAIVTEEARGLLTELEQASAVPPNVPPFSVGRATSSPYRDEDYWQEAGAPIERDDHAEFRAVLEPIRALVSGAGQAGLDDDALLAALVPLRALRVALRDARFQTVHPAVRQRGWSTLLAACKQIVASERLRSRGDVAAVVQAHALVALESALAPASDTGAPHLRSAAAEVLLATGAAAPLSATIQLAVEVLAGDPHPEVRFELAKHLSSLNAAASGLVRRLVERFVRSETNPLVWAGLADTVDVLGRALPDEMARVSKVALERCTSEEHARAARDLFMNRLVDIYIVSGSSIAKDALYDAVQHLNQPGTASMAYRIVAWGTRATLAAERRERTLAVLDALTRGATSAFATLVSSSEAGARDDEAMRRVLDVLDTIGREISQCVRELAEKAPTLDEEERRQRLRQVYGGMATTLEELASTGIAPIVHHVVEALAHCTELDPRRVFLQIARAVESGCRGGYQWDHLAKEAIIELVRRYLADHRALLQDDADSRAALLSILDVFVRAGWPEARDLTYGLEQIFR